MPIGSLRRSLSLSVVTTLAAGLAIVGNAWATADLAVLNDNRVAAGSLASGVLTVQLEARWAGWRPDDGVDSAVTVRALGERGKSAQVPAPLIRVREGTTVALSISNTMGDSAITLHGLRAGTVRDDTVRIEPGTTRRVQFVAGKPGTYLYWGATLARTVGARWGRDGQLTGAIVVDPRHVEVDAGERVFVLTLIDIFAAPDRPKTKEDIWEVAINGRSWPHTERLDYTVGDSVRWRVLNATDRSHPMHLHGFHFRVTAKGNGSSDTTYAPAASRLAVTEFMRSGSTFAMSWMPTRAGSWLFHCHMAAHITPFPVPPDSAREHDMHDAETHARSAMAGLVLGVSTHLAVGAQGDARTRPVRHLRLLAQQRPKPRDTALVRARGFVLQHGAAPARDSVTVPGTPLMLTRGEPTAVTVVNHLSEPTSVHWHGMELTSIDDGVAGWSGSAGARAPLIAPGDSFTVELTAPRAGTFIYHTHMDAEEQLQDGLYGALLVTEPRTVFDASTDRVFVLGDAVIAGKRRQGINGLATPAPLALRAGATYRLRFINIMPVVPATFELRSGAANGSWRAVAKDGAELPAVQRRMQPAKLVIGVGETYDMEWTPGAGTYSLVITLPDGLPAIRQPFRVRPSLR